MNAKRRAKVINLMQRLNAIQDELYELRKEEKKPDPAKAMRDANDALTECLDRLDAATR